MKGDYITRYLIEIQYFVILKIFHIENDSPAIVVYESTLVREEKFGPLETKEEAEAQKLTLQEGYTSNTISIEEREMSRFPVDKVETTRVITLKSSE